MSMNLVRLVESSELVKVNWDARGIGGTPQQIDADYFGFTKTMPATAFLKLAAPIESVRSDASIEFIMTAIKREEKIAPPFLQVKWVESRAVWLVKGHGGRHRCTAAEQLTPGAVVPVHIFPSGMRARHLTYVMRSAPLISEMESKRIEQEQVRRDFESNFDQI